MPDNINAIQCDDGNLLGILQQQDLCIFPREDSNKGHYFCPGLNIFICQIINTNI